MTTLHQSGNLVAGRYQILSKLGQGGIGITYAAEDLKTGQQVALKAMSLRQTNDFKALELFEREARILQQLNHPAIPQYVDYFEVDLPRDRLFYIAQQLAEGQSLETLLERGWQPNETEVHNIAIQILEVLVYLQQLTPPVLHRDIKPQNIIRRSDGWLFLVDFGAVQDTYHNTMLGSSTVVGTYGYMAPEQFRGQAVLGTDLYGLGATLITLLTGKAPADLPYRKLRIHFRPHVTVSKQFADWLERMVEPTAEDRFPSAAEASSALRGEKAFACANQKPARPSDSSIKLAISKEQLVAEIPPIGLGSGHSRFFALLLLIGYLSLWLIGWTINARIFYDLLFHDAFNSASYLEELSNFLIYQIPYGSVFFILWGVTSVSLLVLFLRGAVCRTRLEIKCQNFRLQQWLWGWRYSDARGQLTQIKQARLKSLGLSIRRTPITACTVIARNRSQPQFGSLLPEAEKVWLVAEIEDFLEKQRAIAASKSA
ncbi:serine/threonine protein kinase [Leptolyngbya sp. FACHB-541]|uniref:serine/threonine protein kinase n=1 Tax=Leptolyngbya sp. FACHB-541 TaxID=2692810 RepID=UPI0016846768|nr:serine/threonine-protein kinase [Leptolyngbya sp. FACHB-541]MBD1999979.1 serine/threonine protein kinase [Leptolyngbya sp. FACHB-541]